MPLVFGTTALAICLASGAEPAEGTAPEPVAVTTLQIVPFSPKQFARTGVAWEVTDAEGHALTAPELAAAVGDTSVGAALRKDQEQGRVRALGFGAAGTLLLAAGAISALDSGILAPAMARDKALTGLFLGTGGVFSLASAVLVERGVHFRRAHPSLWWSQDEGALLVSHAHRSPP